MSNVLHLLDGTELRAGDPVMALVATGAQNAAGARRWVKTRIKEVLPGGGVDRAIVGCYGVMGRYQLKAVRSR